MKKVFSLFLCLACFFSVGMLGGCSETDLSGVQSQIDELNATISALEDRLSAAEGKNTELQNELNQATVKLATLEEKINGEPIKYLKEGDTVTFVSNGIKAFNLKVTKGEYNSHSRFVSFYLSSAINNTDDYLELFNIQGILYENDTKKLITDYTLNKPDPAFNRDYYSFSFSGNQSKEGILYLFSGTALFAAYQITFLSI